MTNFFWAQEKEAGPVIPEYGAVWQIEDADMPEDSNRDYKMVLDVMDSPKSQEALNPWIETAARFLNMHARHGVPLERLHVALVVHNKATKDMLQSGSYRERYGVDNPNKELIEALLKANVAIYVCGQSSKSRDLPKEEMIDGTKIALSAMTALITLQDEGYRLIKF